MTARGRGLRRIGSDLVMTRDAAGTNLPETEFNDNSTPMVTRRAPHRVDSAQREPGEGKGKMDVRGARSSPTSRRPALSRKWWAGNGLDETQWWPGGSGFIYTNTSTTPQPRAVLCHLPDPDAGRWPRHAQRNPSGTSKHLHADMRKVFHRPRATARAPDN